MTIYEYKKLKENKSINKYIWKINKYVEKKKTNKNIGIKKEENDDGRMAVRDY